jgi:hypothetical protein
MTGSVLLLVVPALDPVVALVSLSVEPVVALCGTPGVGGSTVGIIDGSHRGAGNVDCGGICDGSHRGAESGAPNDGSEGDGGTVERVGVGMSAASGFSPGLP